MYMLKEGADVIAITAHRLMYLLRLTLVVALAGYMLPTVSFVMHGDFAATYAQQSAAADIHDAHSHDAADTAHDQGDQADNHHESPSKQDCCSNFCLNFAVVADTQQLRVLRASASRVFKNDQLVFAAPIGFIRPPAFRT